MGKSFIIVGGVIVMFLVGVVGFFSLLFGGIFVATSGIVDSADGFFSKAANGDLTAAQTFLTDDYASSFSDVEFAEFVSTNELDKYQTVFWNNRSVENNDGELAGNITTKSNQSIPVKLAMSYEHGKWKIRQIKRTDERKLENDPDPESASLSQSKKSSVDDTTTQPIEAPSNQSHPSNLSQSSLVSTDSNRKIDESILTVRDIPNEEVASALVRKWTDEFCRGVSNKDFAEFLAKTSDEFQNQITLEQFTEIFQSFIDQQMDLRWNKDVEPLFKRSATLDADGVLELAGHFPTDPPVSFEYSFVQRTDEWKPIGVNLRIRPGSIPELPSIDELETLVHGKTLDFGKAISNDDFSAFHSEMSSQFKAKYSAEQFEEIFKSFVEKKADLSWIGSVEPVFDAASTLNTDGVLTTVGHFPVDPRVNFKFSFLNEESIWKVILINITIPTRDESSSNKTGEKETEQEENKPG